MDAFTRRPESFGSSVFPDAQTELRWQDSVLWPVRRPYPLEVPCPVCGAYALCTFFGRQRCPRGHLFGQRAFWSGRPSTCCLLLEDVHGHRLTIHTEAKLHWRDDGRIVVGTDGLRPTAPPAPEAPL
jgi:hypothetical protein